MIGGYIKCMETFGSGAPIGMMVIGTIAGCAAVAGATAREACVRAGVSAARLIAAAATLAFVLPEVSNRYNKNQ